VHLAFATEIDHCVPAPLHHCTVRPRPQYPYLVYLSFCDQTPTHFRHGRDLHLVHLGVYYVYVARGVTHQLQSSRSSGRSVILVVAPAEEAEFYRIWTLNVSI
jgi:hypothetical protein